MIYAIYSLQGFSQNLHAVLCLAENSVGPVATRPDDIHTLYSGYCFNITFHTVTCIVGNVWHGNNLDSTQKACKQGQEVNIGPNKPLPFLHKYSSLYFTL